MAEIIPFRGVLYNAAKVGDMNKVMAPPYDVISPKKQDELYARHPNNIVRLDLNKTTPADTDADNRYTRAAATLQKWLSEGILLRDERPALYYYTQTYTLKDGTKQTRKGFISLARLVDFGKGVHPHERTLSGPKADRLKLMQASSANFSCIFSLYSEPGLGINALFDRASKALSPAIAVQDDDGIENTVWRIDDPAIISSVTEAMKDKTLFIADGHHRYETALNYRNMMREKAGSFTGDEPYNYVMMYLSNMDDTGMTIWPTHRVVHSLKGFDAGSFLAECSKYFAVTEFAYDPSSEAAVRKEFLKKLESSEKTSFGLHIRRKDAYYVLTIKSADTMDSVFGSTIPDVFKDLDVTVLHSLVFARILGMTQEAQEAQQNLIYIKSSEEALNAMNDDANQLVFLLNPTKIEQVKAVAEAGSVMPQKSTYFYPKLLTGLTINLLADKTPEAEPAH
ncbi:MAG TPA: DUF1015 domain-containing protein [Thermodesulfobacteriota bacterium]|nr:DUF1015 domain-containing protein [Thermodesulfobacteriota bacterium]